MAETRQRRCLRFRLALYTTREIAVAEGISTRAVRRHLHCSRVQLGCRDCHELAVRAAALGILPAQIAVLPVGTLSTEQCG